MNASIHSPDLLPQDVQRLNARLDRLESIEAIRTLRNSYHRLVNEDQGQRLYELFAPDATVIYNNRPEVQGRDAIRSFFKNFSVQFARQFIHQHEVEVDGDSGT
ncbi:MAG: nuclear transport factor 2 family protein, partial [Comamonadaceae bacterium]